MPIYMFSYLPKFLLRKIAAFIIVHSKTMSERVFNVLLFRIQHGNKKLKVNKLTQWSGEFIVLAFSTDNIGAHHENFARQMKNSLGQIEKVMNLSKKVDIPDLKEATKIRVAKNESNNAWLQSMIGKLQEWTLFLMVFSTKVLATMYKQILS